MPHALHASAQRILEKQPGDSTRNRTRLPGGNRQLRSRETPPLAADKKDRYVRAYRRPGAAEGWHFLTGDQASIDRLTKAIGFQYRYDDASAQFAHASGITLATPEGKLARYFYGIEFEPRDLQLGLVESSTGKVGSPVDQVLLLCFHYDPLTGRYGLAISGVLRTGALLTVGVLGGFLILMYRQERRRPKLVRAGSTGLDSTDELRAATEQP